MAHIFWNFIQFRDCLDRRYSLKFIIYTIFKGCTIDVNSGSRDIFIFFEANKYTIL